MIPITHQRALRCLILTGVVSLAAFAIACQTDVGPNRSGGGSTEQGAVQPKVNRVRFAIGPPSTEANRAQLGGRQEAWQLAPIYEYLLGVSPEGQELVPQLATEWRVEPDGKSYRFKLRTDVPFQNGFGNMTAQDVWFSWQDIKNDLDPLVSGQSITLSREQIRNVEIVSNHEVVLRMSEPDAGLLTLLSQGESVFPIRSKADGESRSQVPTLQDKPLAGTAPYQYAARETAQWLRYERAPGKHWRQTPDFPEVEFRFIKEPSTMFATLVARENHVAALPPELVPSAKQAGLRAIQARATGFRVALGFQGVWLNKALRPTMVVNPDPNATFVFPNSPMMDVRVRKALNKAIDRDALNKAFIGGEGQPIYNQYFHPTRPGWNPDWERNFKGAYGYDPEAAKKLLVEAGYGPSRPLSTTMTLGSSTQFPAVKDMSEAIAAMWGAVGVKVTLDQTDPAIAVAQSRRGDVENRAGLSVSSARQFAGVTIMNGTRAAARGGVQLPELEQIFDQIAVTLDPQAADKLWRQWGDTAYEQYVNGPLFWLPAYATVDSAIVADYVFPGSSSALYTHVEYIKAAG